jgi:asparagine synthase (glutamine-hydrolysing)
MCGIAGKVSWRGENNIVVVEAMTEALIHRGPDVGTVEEVGNAVLGHRRLRIIDLNDTANQPMIDPESGLVIVFNGEIYNYQDIRRSLAEKGIKFQTQSDTEVLLKAFARWDTDCLDRLIGMYAFAIWDRRAQRLILARDRLGKKPLYYSHDEAGISFASELTALRQDQALDDTISPVALSHFLSLNYTLTEECILSAVKKVPPASYIEIKPGKMPVVTRYWDLAQCFQTAKETTSEQAAREKLADLIDDAVGKRLFSDVPLGAFLSAGIDSASIVDSICGQTPDGQLKAYSMGFSESGFDETKGAKDTAQSIGIDISSRQVGKEMVNSLPKIVAAFDEPFADSSMLPTYFLCAFAREHVTVSLSGDGGDENFAGYPTYVADSLHRYTKPVFGWISPQLSWLFERFGPTNFGKIGWDEKLRRFLAVNHLSFPRVHGAWRMIFSDQEKRDLLSEYVVGEIEADPFTRFESFDAELPNASLLDRAIYTDIKTWLVDDILVKVDRSSMAHSLEVRSPLLDHRIVEFAASLPSSMKLRGLKGKYLLKQMAGKSLPPSVINRPKQGFNAPVSNWLSNELREMGQDITLGSQLSKFVNRKPVEKLWDEHLGRKRDNGLKLFGLLCLGLWLNNDPRSKNNSVSTVH